MTDFDDCLYCYEVDDVTLYIFERFIITESKVEFCDIELFRKVFEFALMHFQTKPFGYISNRIHSNAVSPMIYNYINENIPNIKAVAVVGYSFLAENIFASEVEILNENCQHKFFKDVDRAIQWVNEVLEKNQ